MTFLHKLEAAIEKNHSLACVGLDSDIEKLPQHLRQHEFPLFEFNKAIIDATYDIVCSYKFQIAHYSALGIPGIQQLMQSISYVKSKYPEVPIILDAKRGDIGSTSGQYAKEAFEAFQADAVTVNPYLGYDGVKPFIEYKDKGIIILCRTSNPGSENFQDLITFNEPLYMKVAKKILDWNGENGNCLMVVAATYPEEMKNIRELAKDMFFLVPGIGAQGGDLQATLETGLRPDNSGLIIHSARGIIYASSGPEFAEKAREEAQKLKDTINRYRS